MLEELGLPEVHPLTKEGAVEGGTSSGQTGRRPPIGEGHRLVVYIIELGELGGRHRLKAR